MLGSNKSLHCNWILIVHENPGWSSRKRVTEKTEKQLDLIKCIYEQLKACNGVCKGFWGQVRVKCIESNSLPKKYLLYMLALFVLTMFLMVRMMTTCLQFLRTVFTPHSTNMANKISLPLPPVGNRGGCVLLICNVTNFDSRGSHYTTHTKIVSKIDWQDD